MANSKGKVKVKVEAKKAVKPKMGKGTGGIIIASIKAKVEKGNG
jgi:hypothetical protein